MIRVQLAEGLHHTQKTIIETKHFADEQESDAVKWAKENVNLSDNRIAMIYTCEDETSPTFDLIDVILPNKKQATTPASEVNSNGS
jgi:hypothetical protein